MDNIITIKLKENKETGEHDYHVDFESSPTASELTAAWMILWEVMEHNFDKQMIFTKMSTLYSRIQDIEEVKRYE